MPFLSPTPAAVVLLSGGLDSATTLAFARSRGFACYTLAIHYGQKHSAELVAAQCISEAFSAIEHRVQLIDLSFFAGSALTDSAVTVPTAGLSHSIPVTYVPARNALFLSIALGWAEVLKASAIFIGVNAVDYSGYPDCRPEFIHAFQQLANLATKASVDGAFISIEAPLINKTKADIIRLGIELQVDYRMTVSCYQADDKGAACGKCDACRIRRKGFLEVGMVDPTAYAEGIVPLV